MQRRFAIYLVLSQSIAAAAAGTVNGPPPQAAAKPPTTPANLNCPGSEYAQFKFMLGSWRVGPTGKVKTPAASSWTTLGPCAILEHWMPKNGGDGFSLNYFDQADRKWHQHWVDATGDAVDYIGRWTGTTMQFTADDVATPQMTRVKLTMTFEPLANGRVRQYGTQSTDGGKTFAPAFDFTYVPRKA